MSTTAMPSMAHIKVGDYIVIQRQKYTKLQKFGSIDATTALGNEQLELSALLDQPYSATYRMCPKEEAPSAARKKHGRGARLHTLQLCTETELRNIRKVLGISASGADNRNISDNGESQALGALDIEQLRDEYSDSAKIIEKIVENSKTFHEKTEYSQEKYLKKKERKYFEFVQIHRPTIRLLAEIFYRQDADKVLGLRIDTLSQLLAYSGVCAFGNYLLYESGTNGLLPAAFLNAIGADTTATLVHMHPGNVSQRQAILALNLPDEQLQRSVSVNIYSVLREFYQHKEQLNKADDSTPVLEVSEEAEPSCKKQKLDAAANDDEQQEQVATPAANATSVPTASALKWQLENRRACALLHAQFDSLVVAAKEHPTNIIRALLPFVKPSRPIVVYSQYREVLVELYGQLKADATVTDLHLYANWLRNYQILPDRTHPEINMSGNSGYLLVGCTVAA